MTLLSREQPYPGLRPFDSGDEEFFFGRDAQTQGLRKKLGASRLVAVVGRSGCGKSSLVKAGLIPLLEKEKGATGNCVWHIATFRPQGQPIAELTEQMLALSKARPAAGEAGAARASDTEANALAPAKEAELHRSRLDAMLRRSSQGLVEAAAELALPRGDHLLIIVDQFEEIFRFEGARDSDADEATAFVRLLTEAIHSPSVDVRVILTMRLDFLGDCARFQRLPEAISDGQFLVPNLSRAERRAAIEEPAKKCGASINPAVTQRLLNEIGEDPDRLPVLQHVLMRTWQQAKGAGEIKLADYNATGGVENAISRHANEVYDALPNEEHRRIAERMFKAISELDRRGRAIRRPVEFAELSRITRSGSEPQPASSETGGIGEAQQDPHRARLETVIDQFRAPECCFLMPPAEEELADTTRIDISHESLLRGWRKLRGEQQGEGWLTEEDIDGRIYRNLLEAAQANAMLPPKIARERKIWWDKVKPNAAWAARNGNEFDRVQFFLAASAHRALLRKFAIALSLITTAIGLFLAALTTSYWIGERFEREALDERFTLLTQQHERRLSELNEAKVEIARQRADLDRSRDEFNKALEAAQRSLPQAPDNVREDINRLRDQTQARLDNSAQRVVIDTKRSTADRPPNPLVNQVGYMWIGSRQKGYLRPANSSAALPANAVERSKEYIVTTGIYLRPKPPDRATYAQEDSIGELIEGTRIQLLGVEAPYQRPHGDQYWAQVKVLFVPLPTVFFQFAGGSREQAQQLSRALREKGYTIPGEERTSGAAGKRVVRYFDQADSAAADKLAKDAQDVLQDLGYASKQPVTTERINQSTKSNPDENLELWIEIPPK